MHSMKQSKMDPYCTFPNPLSLNPLLRVHEVGLIWPPYTWKIECSWWGTFLGVPPPWVNTEIGNNANTTILREYIAITAKKLWAVSFWLVDWAFVPFVFALLSHFKHSRAVGFEILLPRCLSFLELIKLSCAIIIYFWGKRCEIQFSKCNVHKSKTI